MLFSLQQYQEFILTLLKKLFKSTILSIYKNLNVRVGWIGIGIFYE